MNASNGPEEKATCHAASCVASADVRRHSIDGERMWRGQKLANTEGLGHCGGLGLGANSGCDRHRRSRRSVHCSALRPPMIRSCRDAVGFLGSARSRQDEVQPLGDATRLLHRDRWRRSARVPAVGQ